MPVSSSTSRARPSSRLSCGSTLPAGELRRSTVVEDEELAAASDVADHALAHEVAEEMAPVPPDLGVRLHRQPVAADDGPGFDSVAP